MYARYLPLVAVLAFVNAEATIIATGDTRVVDNNFNTVNQPLGPDSTDVGANQVYVANGSLSVTGGSVLSAGKLTQAGWTADSNVTVDGAGSKVVLSRDSSHTGGQFGHDSAPGRTANMTISNGGSLVYEDPNSQCTANFQCFVGQIGNAAGSTANVNVTGAGSLLDLKVGNAWQTLIIGDASVFTQADDGFDFGVPGGATTATVTVSGGARFDSGITYVAWGGGGPSGNGNESVTATVIVTGAGSEWNADAIAIGYHKTDPAAPNTSGTVLVSNGGVINAPVFVGAGGLLGGNGTINGNVTNQGGTIAPGNSPGTLTINGDLAFSSGLLVIEIAGAAAGQFDVLLVNGNTNFAGGTILFSFLDGFAPSANDFFEFIVSTGSIFLDSDVLFETRGLQEGFEFNVGFDQATGRFGLLALNDGVAVPEPGTLALLGLGLAGLGLSRRRKH